MRPPFPLWMVIRLTLAAVWCAASVPATAQPTAPAATTPPPASALEQRSIAVLPLRCIGIDDTTAQVVQSLLESELRSRGVPVVLVQPAAPTPSTVNQACDEPACAAAALREVHADRVAYGSMSRLGQKILVRLSVLSADATVPAFTDQLTASSEEDLDTVARRFAQAIAAGQTNAHTATVVSVLEDEAREPRLRATRRGLGFRAGFLFPTGDSYGGVDRLTNLHLSYKYERPNLMIETTTALGFTFGDGNVEWTILDLAAAWIPSLGDVSPYLGGGIGVHSVHVEQKVRRTDPFGGYDYFDITSQTETVPTVDVVCGVLGFRTFDFEIVLEARYHYVFEKFDAVGGDGAQGVMLTIGTSR